MALVSVVCMDERLLYAGRPVGPDFRGLWRPKEDGFGVLEEEGFALVEVAVVEGPEGEREGEDECDMADGDAATRVDEDACAPRHGDATRTVRWRCSLARRPPWERCLTAVASTATDGDSEQATGEAEFEIWRNTRGNGVCTPATCPASTRSSSWPASQSPPPQRQRCAPTLSLPPRPQRPAPVPRSHHRRHLVRGRCRPRCLQGPRPPSPRAKCHSAHRVLLTCSTPDGIAQVAFKALIVLHTMIRNGATDNILAHLSSSEVLRLHNVSAGNWEGIRVLSSSPPCTRSRPSA